MNYREKYDELIESRSSLNRKKTEGCFESHHIIPKCFGGSNGKENRVLLTPKEHFIAHLLLTECYMGIERRSMVFALSQMMRSNKYQQRIHSASRYDMVRRLESEVQIGVPKTEEQKRKISQSLTGRPGCNLGKKYSEEHCRKIGLSKKGRVKTQEEIEKIRLKAIGRKMPPLTAETKAKMSEAAKKRCATQEYKDRMFPLLRTLTVGRKMTEEHRRKIGNAQKGRKMSDETKAKIAEAKKARKAA